MNKHMDGKSFDTIQARIAELKRLFPEAVKEGRFDPELLVGLLEEHDEVYGLNDERYDFTWKGKAEALRLAQRRSDGTLRPCFEESRDWDTTQNLYIEGDNLEVMKLLQQGYLRSVKMIYIDPPYNTGNDFVYQDDFADPIAKYKEATGQGMRANPETAGRYHSNWLSMMYPRLKIAKTLLRDDGVIFISIDDNEVHNLRKLCDEVFGEENFVALIPWQSRQSIQNDTDLSINHEYIAVYSKRRRLDNRRLKENNILEWSKKNSFVCHPLPVDEGKYVNPDNDPRGKWKADPFDAPNIRQNLTYPITNPTTGETFLPPAGRCWRTEESKFQALLADNRIVFGRIGTSRPQLKVFYSEKKNFGSIDNTWFSADRVGTATMATKELQKFFDGQPCFDTPKPTALAIKLLQLSGVEENDIVLDFFSGSATTAEAVMTLNAQDYGRRKFIMVQIPEPLRTPDSDPSAFATLADIGKERIRRAGDKIVSLNPTDDFRLDIGFRVFKLDSSNLQKWDGSYVPPENADLFLDLAERSLDTMKPDRRDIDMVYEVFLKYGVPLTEKLSTLDVQGKTFYVVGDTGYLMICLDQGITVELIEEMIKLHTPGAVIFADQCFADDNELTNAGLVLDKAQIEFRWI